MIRNGIGLIEYPASDASMYPSTTHPPGPTHRHRQRHRQAHQRRHDAPEHDVDDEPGLARPWNAVWLC